MDYNIYLKNLTSDGNSSHTVPKIVSSSGKATSSSKIKPHMVTIKGILGKAARKVPAIAAAMIIVKVADEVASTALDLQAGYSGNPRLKMNYSNIKNTLMASLSPVSTLKTYFTRQMEEDLNSQKVSEERTLTGNSIINNYGGKAS